MTESRYRAFISYSHGDRRWGEWLHRALESYAPPKHLVGLKTGVGEVPQRFAPVFRDRDELPSASNLGKKVEDALQRSDNLVVICSPAAARSPWVNQEILAYKRLGRSDRIFCLIVDGEPGASAMPGREGDECFPPAVRHELGADGQLDESRPAEPIAADARPEGDGRANARLKLLAGMLDLGFDALRQRELARKHRRITAIASAAVVLAAVMAVLAVQAMVARTAADEARRAAERRQAQAEDLIGFMLGDLNTKLVEVDRLDILGDVADKAMQYFRALPKDDLSNVGMDQRVTALVNIGDVRGSQGKADAALQAYQSALAISEQLARQSPKDPGRQAAYAKSLSLVGKSYWQQGDGDAAANAFARAATVMESAITLAPGSKPLLEAMLSEATNNGRVLEAAGRLDAAERSYREVLDIARRLVALEPGNRKMQGELGYAYNNLGVLAATRGELRTALNHYLDDLAIKQSLSEADPRDNNVRSDLGLALMFTAKLRGQLGEMDAAVQDERRAAELYTDLLRFDPSQVAINVYYQGLAYRGLANLLLDAGRAEEARAAAAQAQAAMAKTAAADPSNQMKSLRLWETRLLPAKVDLLEDRPARALQQAMRVDAGLAAMQVGDAYKKEQARLRALALLVIADAAGPGQALAGSSLARAGTLLDPHVTDDTRDPDLLDPWLRIAAARGTTPFPQPNLDALRASGYASPGFVRAMARSGIGYSPAVTPATTSTH